LLTGKIKPGHHFSEGDTREGNRFYTDENIIKVNQLLEDIQPIAEEHGATLAQVVVNWTVQQHGIACVLVGARNERQVADNARALDFSLSDQELKTITELSNHYSAPPIKV
jgi:aryl-alcohol dehydrogenase-like predicted oxidoreductase